MVGRMQFQIHQSRGIVSGGGCLSEINLFGQSTPLCLCIEMARFFCVHVLPAFWPTGKPKLQAAGMNPTAL